MRGVLLDADAVLCLHSLQLLERVVPLLASVRRVVLTEYVARRELNALSARIGALLDAGHVSIEPLMKGTPAATRYRELQRSHDKGESECVAWALEVEPRPLFVTRDQGATRLAEAHGVPVTDVMGAVVEACETAGLSRDVARSALALWDDKEQQRCRPSPYHGFDATYAARLAQRAAWA